jgi:hypothetical protein
MKVKWIEQMSSDYALRVLEMYPDANLSDFDKEYEGEVIGATESFMNGTNLIIGCSDGKIRQCPIDLAKVVK